MNSELKRIVKPVGNLLNDNDSGVDQLGYIVYAEALAKLLHNCRPPLTVGVFAPWGSGKTFLVKHVQGFLYKYERQDQNDLMNKKKLLKNIDSSTKSKCEIDDEISTALSKTEPKNMSRIKNSRRRCGAISGTLICITFIVVISVLLALIFTPWMMNGGGSSSHDYNSTADVQFTPLRPLERAALGNETATVESPTRTTTDDVAIIESNIRLYLVIVLAVVTALLFAVFCCCISNTDSKCCSRFKEFYCVPVYAAFVRIPSLQSQPTNSWFETSNPYMVVNMDDDSAKLQAFDRSDEAFYDGFHIRSDDVNSMPVKYIYVNYHAWQYAGTDVLWAGIVTNLSDAIEKEFGAVCPRLFRIMAVERPSKFGPLKLKMSKDPRAIYVQFYFSPSDEDTQTDAGRYRRVHAIMKFYGVLTQCCHVNDINETHSWWFARFSTEKEASYAETSLRLGNFEVRRESPCKMNSMQHANIPKYTAQNGSHYNAIQMNNLGTESRVVEDHDTATEPTHTSVQVDDTDCNNAACSCRFLGHFRRHPKTVCCGCPYLFCCILFAFASLIFPITIALLASDLEVAVLQSTRNIPIEVQIFSWLPATIGVVVIAGRFCWAMCNSQTDRIKKAMSGSSGRMEIAAGFMKDVKEEVNIITQFLNCVRFTHHINYKVVITIDDLDRCPTDRVKSVLEAVSILLSDRASPFICLLALDSRVAVKCVEQNLGEALIQANVSGHEYLKKIINLPFCLPEVSNRAKKSYLGGLMDVADETKLRRENTEEPQRRKNFKKGGGDMPDAVGTDDDEDDSQSMTGSRKHDAVVDGRGRYRMQTREDAENLRNKFLIHCREFLYNDDVIQRHLLGNPRNIKRIFNVLSLTVHIMDCMKKSQERLAWIALHSERIGPSAVGNCTRKPILNSELTSGVCFSLSEKDAEDLVRWVILTDQWPFLISYILQVIEDADQNRKAGIHAPFIKETCSLSYIFESYVEPELAQEQSSWISSMLNLDADPSILRSFLRKFKTLTRERVSMLFPMTVNLDQCLRNGISRHRYKPQVSLPTVDASTSTDTTK